jgi:hypothetical protein
MSCKKLVKLCGNILKNEIKSYNHLHIFDRYYSVRCSEFTKWKDDLKGFDGEKINVIVEDNNGLVNRFYYMSDPYFNEIDITLSFWESGVK